MRKQKNNGHLKTQSRFSKVHKTEKPLATLWLVFSSAGSWSPVPLPAWWSLLGVNRDRCALLAAPPGQPWQQAGRPQGRPTLTLSALAAQPSLGAAV